MEGGRGGASCEFPPDLSIVHFISGPDSKSEEGLVEYFYCSGLLV